VQHDSAAAYYGEGELRSEPMLPRVVDDTPIKVEVRSGALAVSAQWPTNDRRTNSPTLYRLSYRGVNVNFEGREFS
jgi:hypothetical protein